jgi:hypothetical protein
MNIEERRKFDEPSAPHWFLKYLFVEGQKLALFLSFIVQ